MTSVPRVLNFDEFRSTFLRYFNISNEDILNPDFFIKDVDKIKSIFLMNNTSFDLDHIISDREYICSYLLVVSHIGLSEDLNIVFDLNTRSVKGPTDSLITIDKAIVDGIRLSINSLEDFLSVLNFLNFVSLSILRSLSSEIDLFLLNEDERENVDFLLSNSYLIDVFAYLGYFYNFLLSSIAKNIKLVHLCLPYYMNTGYDLCFSCTSGIKVDYFFRLFHFSLRTVKLLISLYIFIPKFVVNTSDNSISINFSKIMISFKRFFLLYKLNTTLYIDFVLFLEFFQDFILKNSEKNNVCTLSIRNYFVDALYDVLLFNLSSLGGCFFDKKNTMRIESCRIFFIYMNIALSLNKSSYNSTAYCFIKNVIISIYMDLDYFSNDKASLFFCIDEFYILLKNFVPFDEDFIDDALCDYIRYRLCFCRNRWISSVVTRGNNESLSFVGGIPVIDHFKYFIENSRGIFCMFDIFCIIFARDPMFCFADTSNVLNISNIIIPSLSLNNKKHYHENNTFFRRGISLFSSKLLFESFVFLTPGIEGIIFDELQKRNNKIYADVDGMSKSNVYQRCILSSIIDSCDGNSYKTEFFNDLVELYGIYFVMLYDYIFLGGSLLRKKVVFSRKQQGVHIVEDIDNSKINGWRLRHMISHGLMLDDTMFSDYINIAFMWILMFYSFSPEEIKEYTKEFDNEIINDGFLRIDVFNNL